MVNFRGSVPPWREYRFRSARNYGGGYKNMFLQRYTLYFADRLQGKKRSLLVTGPPDSGKSFVGLLVRNQLPKCRVSPPLSTSEFRRGILGEEMHLLRKLAVLP